MTEKLFQILINNRNYSSYEIMDANKFDKVVLDIIDPFKHKLFTNDIFTVNENNQVKIVSSSIRNGLQIPAVLILHGDKTYGRHSNGKLLYKGVPDDIRLPAFLVFYELKHLGFSKVLQNLYVTLTFNEWTNDKHPSARLNNVIGPVDVLNNFYEYQLYCKSLNVSIQKFHKDATKLIEPMLSSDKLIETIINKYPNIEDRTDQKKWHIITIDPLNTKDVDDGVSIKSIDNNVKLLSIYISNVALWMDMLNLWESFSKRISTIYLPDKKRPMLPTVLSDGLCSLKENVKRIAFVMDVYIENNIIKHISFCNAIVKVYKNYSYEEPKLLSNNKYHELLKAVKELSIEYKYIHNLCDSHELVCYLMIFMNFQCANHLIKYKTGIFRSTIIKNNSNIIPDIIPNEVSNYIKNYNSTSGQYIDGSKIVNVKHELLNLDAYMHITSPIRRLVDLLNMIKFQHIFNTTNLSEKANIFYDKWLNELEYINITIKSIKKVQNECLLLELCHNDPSMLEKEYDGYLFNKIEKNAKLFQYVVFLPNLQFFSKITLSEDYENYSNKKIRLFLFNNEDKFKRKIRMHLI